MRLRGYLWCQTSEETVLTASFALAQCESDRLSWGVFRDRRPEMYGEIVK